MMTAPIPGLYFTPRELDTLRAIKKWRGDRVKAREELGISRTTLNTYLDECRSKTYTKSIPHLIRYVSSIGVV